MIDTRKPFRHTVSFPLDRSGVLTSIKNAFEQQGRTFEFDSCGVDSQNAQWTAGDSARYLREMQANLERGMVMTLSLWGVSNSGMSWLDGPTGCKGDCNVSASGVAFSDLSLDWLAGEAR